MIYVIYWLHNQYNFVYGDTIEEAFTAAGYGAGAVAAIDHYEVFNPQTHPTYVRDVENKKWVKRIEKQKGYSLSWKAQYLESALGSGKSPSGTSHESLDLREVWNAVQHVNTTTAFIKVNLLDENNVVIPYRFLEKYFEKLDAKTPG